MHWFRHKAECRRTCRAVNTLLPLDIYQRTNYESVTENCEIHIGRITVTAANVELNWIDRMLVGLAHVFDFDPSIFYFAEFLCFYFLSVKSHIHTQINLLSFAFDYVAWVLFGVFFYILSKFIVCVCVSGSHTLFFFLSFQFKLFGLSVLRNFVAIIFYILSVACFSTPI